MPHINRIRVNNVKYNFGTQFYDDFMMRFSCKNTIYDLANGGGKSVLMLLLLQNLIPNCTLDDKQPIEKLFRTNEGSSVIHSMIEWKLSDVHVKDGFKYMLTGFCARRAKDQGEDENQLQEKNGTSIEYFNYCIFYRSFNDNDIKNFPLSNNGERITFSGLKNYLKNLQKNDFNIDVKIFERKGDYQRFIAEYGLYESEWEIIRGINKTEGHVRTYFETNYKTTRKVVEDLLIEEIIEKSFKNKYSAEGSEGNLAETLLNIKDKLLELSKKKEEINNYDHQIEIIDGFAERVSGILKLYSGIEEAFLRLKKAYNSLEIAENRNKLELETAQSKKADVIEEKNKLAKKVDTARVLVDMKEIERLTESYESESLKLEILEEEIQNHIDKLNILEGGNHYLEYIQYKKEYDKLKVVMDNILKDNGSVISKLKDLVATKKLIDENASRTISEEIGRETISATKEAENLKKLSDEIRNIDNQIAVATYQIEADEKKISVLENQISEKKMLTSLLLPTDARRALKNSEEKENEEKNRLDETKALQSELQSELIDLQVKLHQENYKLDEEEKKKEKLINNKNKSLSSFDKLKKIKQVYGEEDLDNLIHSVSKTYRNMISSINELNNSISEKEHLIKNYELGNGFEETEKFSEIIEYIRRYHCKNAISGAEYLKNLGVEKATEIQKINPVISYAIIVPSNFEQIYYDQKLKEIAGKEKIVLINEIALMDLGNEVIDSNMIAFISEEIIFDGKLVAEKVAKLKMELEELNKQYIRKSENEKIVEDDYIFLMTLAGEKEEADDPEQELKEINENISLSLKTIEELKNDISKAKAKDNELSEMLTGIIKEMTEIKEENRIYSDIVEMLDEFNALENAVKDNRSIKLKCEKEQKDAKSRYEAAENMHNQRQARINARKEELEMMAKEWTEKFEPYFDNNIYEEKKLNPKAILEIDSKELEINLLGLLESLKKENAQVADKEKLQSNYQTSMERSLSHIDYMGIDVKIFENLYMNNELVNTSKHDLAHIKRENTLLRDEEKKLRKSINEIRSAKDKLQGKVNHEIAMITEKYGDFDKDLIKSEEIHTFLNENSKILGNLEASYGKLAVEIKEFENKAISISILKRDVTKLMTKSSVKVDSSVGVFERDKDIEKECKEVSDKLDNFIEEKFKRGEAFDKELILLTDTLKKLNAHELASEIRINVSMPSDLDETKELINMFKETNELIELEKQRVIRGLDDMQIIKDNFENQCIQSCVNIKTELDRLSKLSRITMEDETIPVINLKIPYVKEETFKERMSDYIDRVAKATDQFESTDEKLRYIKNNLCWKKMFSVIVTDMNAIRLNLYKRERIADQSRFLPYEEAVGSTGQSQGIYIQFLISVINYISSINSRNADAWGLKKVIFIDNPFGAAKDVYIWEPIFKLLKANNVQLIVPARGATPAITGRFDVNYVLGQKICEGRQQTVVVDYFSNVTNEEMDYTTLSYEQTALF